MSGGPVFVLTAHRSGGTALARALNRHPDLMIWGEHAGFINKLAEMDAVVSQYPPLTQSLANRDLDGHVARDKFNPDGFAPWFNPFEQADWRAECRRFLEGTFKRGLHPGQRWGFKEVRYHTLTLARFLLALFPDARFVILRRELAPLVLSNMLAPWSMEMLRRQGATTSAAELRAAVHDCAYALAVVNRGLAEIANSFPGQCCVVLSRALDAPTPTFAALFGFLGLSHWPALLEEVAEACGRRLGTTDMEGRQDLLCRDSVTALLPEAIAAAEAALAAGGPDLARLKRLGPVGRYSFLVGDHEVSGTDFSTMF